MIVNLRNGRCEEKCSECVRAVGFEPPPWKEESTPQSVGPAVHSNPFTCLINPSHRTGAVIRRDVRGPCRHDINQAGVSRPVESGTRVAREGGGMR
jgi:hypothetical protein